MTTIKTKIAANGTALYYVDGKHVSRDVAIEAATVNRNGNPFNVIFYAYNTSVGNFTEQTVSVNKLAINLRRESHTRDIVFNVEVNGTWIKSFCGFKTDADKVKQAKKDASLFVDKIVAAYIADAYGVNIVDDFSLISAPEADVEDHAVTVEAQDAAIDAEIENANNSTDEIVNVENLTANQKLAAQIVAKLGNLIVKCNTGEYGTRSGKTIHYETYADENDEFGTTLSIVEVFTDEDSFILDHVNLIKGYGDDKTVETFYFTKPEVESVNVEDYAVTIEAQDVATEAEIELATVNTESSSKESAPADDFETKLAELQAIVDAAQANYDAKDAKFIKLQRAIINARKRRSHAYIKLQAAKRDLDVFVAFHKQAEFLWDKIQCESKPLDDDNVWDLLPKVDELNDVQDDEPTPPYKPQCTWENPHDFTTPGNLNFDPNDRLRAYLNPVDDLNNPPTKPTPEYKPQCTWENPHTIVMKTALLRCQIACQVLDIPAALNELKLFATYRDANKVELEEEPAPTPKRARQIDNNETIASKLKKAAKRRVSFINRLNDAIKSVEDECAFNQVCYDEPDDNNELDTLDAELKQLIAKGLKLIRWRDAIVKHLNQLTSWLAEYNPKSSKADYEKTEAEAVKYDDTVKDLDKQIETVEDECAFNQVCYDEPDDSRERVHFDAELKKLIDKGLRLIQKRDKLATHRDRLYLTIERLDAQVI